mmetsp:Transcript_28948/g.69139  ORF Transcript_28948/g.69139 Transcript_28948/m.69139 type:complete len:478 (-) Transcript_28948:1455-2888(-)
MFFPNENPPGSELSAVHFSVPVFRRIFRPSRSSHNRFDKGRKVGFDKYGRGRFSNMCLSAEAEWGPNPRTIPLFLRGAGPHAAPELQPRAGGPDGAADHRGDAAVQANLPRAGRENGAAGDDDAEVHPDQRHRERRRHRAPPHLLRDARQLLLWRLLQARGHQVGLGALHQGVWPPRIACLGERLRGGRRGLCHLAGRGRRARVADQAHGGGGQLLGERADGAVRAVLRALLRPAPRARRGRRRPRGRLEVHRVLQHGFHGAQPGAGRNDVAARQQEHRHGHGPRAHGADPPGNPEQLRDGPHIPHRVGGREARRHRLQQSLRGREDRPQGHRRPQPRRCVPHLRRRASVQRRPRLRGPAPSQARHHEGPHSRDHRTLHRPPGGGRRVAQRPVRPKRCGQLGPDLRGDAPRGGALLADAGARAEAARRAPAGRQRQRRGRRPQRGRRLPPVRHVWVPARDHDRGGGGGRDRGGHRRV